jgi:2-polyprenyl-3-methyl-5-hydroxy-6-metoxy-1,4-benzoquinol methylase
MEEMVQPLRSYHRQPRPEVVEQIEPRGLRILDVGCAAGEMGALMLEQGAREVVGLEVHPEAVAEAKTRLTAVHPVDLEDPFELPYPDGHFDRMAFADVLEHLRDPAALLVRLERYLAPDGVIVCSIPNIRHESVLVPLLVHGRFPYVDEGILDRTHLRFFTAVEIAALLDEAGFSLLAGSVRVNRTVASPFLEPMADLVRRVGGDEARYREEATIVQYIVKARRKEGAASALRTGSPG